MKTVSGLFLKLLRLAQSAQRKLFHRHISDPLKIANAFNKQYTSIVRHTSSKETRKITKSVRSNNLSDAPKFNTSQTKDAISNCKASKAIGPDGISNLHMKHLGPKGIEYLTKIYNLSMETCEIPSIWKSDYKRCKDRR